MNHRTEFLDDSETIRPAVELFSNLNRTEGRYSNVAIASDLNVSEAAIRKWFEHCRQVCPVAWLKVGGKHTDLSAALLADYQQRVSQGELAPEAWVVEMRSQFPQSTQEPSTSQALTLHSNAQTAEALDLYLQELGADVLAATRQVDTFDDQLAADEVALIQAEIEAAKQKGAKKAVLLHAAQKQAENETRQALLQRDIQRRRGGAGEG